VVRYILHSPGPALCRRRSLSSNVRLLGEHALEFGGGVSNAGRPRLPIRLMASLLYLKHAFNLSDEELVQRWSENVVWQFFSGMDYYEPRCRATPRRSDAFAQRSAKKAWSNC
jgi:hypothetical protein